MCYSRIFASTQFPWAGSEEVQSKQFDRMKFVPLAPPLEAAAKLAAYQQQIAELESRIKKLEASGDAEATQLAALRDELRNLRKPGLPEDLPGAYAVQEGAVVETRVQLAGEPNQPGDLRRAACRGSWPAIRPSSFRKAPAGGCNSPSGSRGPIIP